jgi:hypothetical protein
MRHHLESVEAAIEALSRFHSAVDLTEQVGAITPEERDTLSRVNFDADPTPQELEALGPDFAQRVIDRTIIQLNQEPGVPSYKVPFWLLQSSIVLEIVEDIQQGTLHSNRGARELAEQLADVYTRRLANFGDPDMR